MSQSFARPIAAILLLLTAPALAFQAPPEGRVLSDFDSRTGRASLVSFPASATALTAVRDLESEQAVATTARWSANGQLRWLHAGGRGLSGVNTGDPETIARAFLASRAALVGLEAGDDLELTFLERASSGFTHVGLRQRVDGVPVFDGYVRVDLDRDLRVVALGVADARFGFSAEATPRVAPTDAVALATAAAGAGPIDVSLASPATSPRLSFATPALRRDASADLVWFPSQAGAVLAWRVAVEPRGYPASYVVLIDATTGALLYRQNQTRYVDTRANVFTDSPDKGPRTLEVIYDDAVNVRIAWPKGWLDADLTVGNNVVAQDDRAGDDEVTMGVMPGAIPGAPQLFDPGYTTDPAIDLDLAVVNLFWGINRAHEHFYRLGFDEGAGNFQTDNFGRGGSGGDPVLADAQDSADTLFDAIPGNDVANNANFNTPSDGNSGRVQMYLWNNPAPLRDGDLDQDIVVHEFLHGVSTRLVGGRLDVSCLFSAQSGAMGEAWGDFFAGSMTNDAVVAEHSTQDFANGIRTAPMDADNYTYGDLCTIAVIMGIPACEVHADGEIWAQALWEARAAFVAAYGLARGRADFEQLTIDAMKLSPCNPSFLDMRDAILMADQHRFGGANYCRLWQVFAQTGMGENAADNTAGDYQAPIEGFAVPTLCLTPATTSSIQWRLPRVSCDDTARITVTDSDLTLPASITVTSAAGDSLTLPLMASAGGAPSYETATFPVLCGPVDPSDAVLQGACGDALTATYLDQNPIGSRSDVATMACAANVTMSAYRFVDATCDADTVPGFPALPGFLDTAESAVLEVELRNDEAFPITGAVVTLTSSNPKVTIAPTTAMAIGDIPAAIGTNPALKTIRFLAAADATVITGDTADLTLTFTATGFTGTAAPIQWTIRLNLDYQVQTRSFTESFETTSPTAAAWTHGTTIPTPTGDEWKLVSCNAAAGMRSYKNGGGDPACGNYTDTQGNPYLASPPLRFHPPTAEAGRLTRVRFQHDIQLGVPTDPAGGVCDAEGVMLILTNSPATIDASDPLTLFITSIGGWTVVPLLGINDNTVGFVPQDIDLSTNTFPGVDLGADAYLTWLFLPDFTNALVPPALPCAFFPAVGEGYYTDEVVLDWEEVVAVPSSSLCIPECKALAVSDPSAAEVGCVGDPVALDGSPSLVINCPGSLQYRWSGAELGPPGPWTVSPTAIAMPSAPTRYQLDVVCAASPNCVDSTEALIVPLGQPPVGDIGNSLRMTRIPSFLHFDWTLGPVAPRNYNIHEAAAKASVTDLAIATQPVVLMPTAVETIDLALPAGAELYYEVYGRDTCTGLSVIP